MPPTKVKSETIEDLEAALRAEEAGIEYWTDPHRVGIESNLQRDAARARAADLRRRIAERRAAEAA